MRFYSLVKLKHIIRNPFKLTVMLMLCTARLMTYLVLYYTDHTSAALDMF